MKKIKLLLFGIFTFVGLGIINVKASDMPVVINSFALNSSSQQGVATDGDYIYTSFWNLDGKFAKYKLDGTFIEEFTISGITGGIRDLTFDGDYFYGGATSNILYKIDLENKTLISTITTEVSIIRHCSYDFDNDVFWVGNWYNLYTINRSGEIISTIDIDLPNNGIYSSSYDNISENGPFLWLFSQSTDDLSSEEYIKYDIANNAKSFFTVDEYTEIEGYETATAGGSFIGTYNSRSAIYTNVQDEPNYLFIYDLGDVAFHQIKHAPTEHGSFSANKKYASAGETITITTTPEDNYKLKNIKIFKTSDNSDVTTEVSYNSANKTFTMPDYRVELVVEFEIITYTITIPTGTNYTTNPVGTVTVNIGSNKEIIITPNTGYRLATVKVNNVVQSLPLSDNKISLTDIKENKTLEIQVEKIIYVVINGAGQKHFIGTNKDAVFRIDADFNKFSKVYLNDEELSTDFYTATEGSTIITINQNHLNNLLPGTYNLRATFNDGGESTTTFIIANFTPNPATGDGVINYIVLGSIALIGLLGIGLSLKKKIKNY